MSDAMASSTSSALLQLAMRFPDAAKWVWDAYLALQTQLATLSPDVRAKLYAAFSWLLTFFYSLVTVFSQVYHNIMALPGTPTDAWSSPPDVLLKGLARVILFFAPMQAGWENGLLEADADGSSKLAGTGANTRILFVANSGLLSLESLSLTASIYLSTNTLPRRYTDVYHFRIPLWKHIIEFLGAVPAHPSTFNPVVAAGYPILIHPGGRRAAFVNSSGNGGPVNELNWTPGRLSPLLALAAEHRYRILAVGTTGVDAMVGAPLFNLRIDPILWVLGEGRGPAPTPGPDPFKEMHKLPPQLSEENLISTMPVVFPRSYQRQYVYVRAVAEGSSGDETRVMEAVLAAVESAKTMQLADGEKRFLLKGLIEKLHRAFGSVANAASPASGESSSSGSRKEVGLEDVFRMVGGLFESKRISDLLLSSSCS
ncbi:hypothetical protein DFJ73DRAFT_344115 [Zopfochytrium polystomum]|nr:hypothetical protein DFJ73DRAFT_344115 [Zopfochytrium polystomum]